MLMKFCLKLRLGAFLLGILTTKFHHLGKNLTLWQVFGRSSSIWQNFVPALRILWRLGKVSFLRMDKYIMYDQSSHLVTLHRIDIFTNWLQLNKYPCKKMRRIIILSTQANVINKF